MVDLKFVDLIIIVFFFSFLLRSHSIYYYTIVFCFYKKWSYDLWVIGLPPSTIFPFELDLIIIMFFFPQIYIYILKEIVF